MKPRQVVAFLTIISILGACTSGPATPEGSDGDKTIVHVPGVPDGLFSDPPAPHDLQPRLANRAAASAVVGPEGGRLVAEGPLGARFALVIPPGALALPTTITMTPLRSLGGLGLSREPEHVFGVELAPDGLRLITPAHLTTSPRAAIPEAGVATGSYHAHGEDAGLLLHEASASELTIEISHFSGYWSIWPIAIEDWRVLANDRQREIEERLVADVATVLGVEQQKQFMGVADEEPAGLQPAEILRGLLKKFDTEVLQNRLKLAKNGCVETELAIWAYTVYQHQLQLSVDATDLANTDLLRPIPQELLDLRWRLCLDEAYQRCVVTGDFAYLATFLLDLAHKAAALERPLSAAQEADGMDRLQRCGRWRVKIETWLLDQGAIGHEKREAVSEFDVKWQPAAGEFGLTGSKIEGSGDVEVTDSSWVFLGDPAPLTNFRTQVQASVRIDGLAFAYVGTYGMEPYPVELNLFVYPGAVEFDAHFATGPQHFEDGYFYGWRTIFNGGYAVGGTIKKGWEFEDRPFEATMDLSGEEPNAQIQGTRSARIEIVLEHTPS